MTKMIFQNSTQFLSFSGSCSFSVVGSCFFSVMVGHEIWPQLPPLVRKDVRKGRPMLGDTLYKTSLSSSELQEAALKQPKIRINSSFVTSYTIINFHLPLLFY